jgi:hypothetical protein
MAQKKPAAAAAKSLKKPAKPQAKTQRAATAVAKTAETVSAKPAAPAKPEKAAPAVNATPPAAAPLLQAVEAAAAKPVQPALRAIDIAVEALASAPKAVQAVKPDQVVAPVATLLETGAEQARQAYARAQATSEAFRQAVADTATATSRGAIEVNSKVLDAFRAQSDAALDLWRSTLAAGTVADAIRAQTSGTRQVYETTASQWKDIAETTGRWVSAAVKPMQSVWTGQGR